MTVPLLDKPVITRLIRARFLNSTEDLLRGFFSPVWGKLMSDPMTAAAAVGKKEKGREGEKEKKREREIVN